MTPWIPTRSELDAHHEKLRPMGSVEMLAANVKFWQRYTDRYLAACSAIKSRLA